MRLWRISNHADLSGDGALRISGRWHSRGSRIVYLADHPAAALLEVLVHLEVDREDLPHGYQLLAVDFPDDLTTEAVDETDLPLEWRDHPEQSRGVGDQWLRDQQTALLAVPSAIVPQASNWLLNPSHGDAARAHIAERISAAFDRRLFGSEGHRGGP
jgi:RES domain-containing protein